MGKGASIECLPVAAETMVKPFSVRGAPSSDGLKSSDMFSEPGLHIDQQKGRI